MKISDVKNCFNGFQGVFNFIKNDNITSLAIVILLGFAAACGLASLYGRISKKKDPSSNDKNVNDISTTILLKNDRSISPIVDPSNRQLAEKIIAAREKDQYIKTICSGDFLMDPAAHLIHEMINRGVGGCSADDGARSFIINQIPGFIEKISSLDYLRSFAEFYFENTPNKSNILEIFEKSLLSEEFQKNLKSALGNFNGLLDKETSLRIPLTIYVQSAELKEYSYPEDANME